MTRGELLAGFHRDPALRAAFVDALRGAPFGAFLWETPAWTLGALDEVYEHVLVESRRLASTPADPSAFDEHFDQRPAVTFASLRGDATLVAPSPRAAPDAGHLASFVRTAPAETIDALLVQVASAMRASLSGAPVWLSTSGLAVPWLHVRIDNRPKYYAHAPYRRPP